MMELLSNSCIPKQMASASSNNTGSNLATTNGSAATTERLLAGILDTFPSWNMGVGMGGGAALIGNNGGNGAIKNNSPSRQDYEYFYNNFHATNEFGIGPLAGLGGAAVNSISGGSGGGGGGGVGVGMGAGMRPKISPDASNNSTINCGWCDVNASIRCLECNEFMCNDCLREHRKSSLSSNHSIVSLPRPIGTSPTSAISNNMPVAPAPSYLCDQHNEILRYVCESCKKVVCQFCTLHEHKEHCYSSIQSFVEDSREKIEAALESGRMGTTCIKSGIDKALLFIRHIEKNCVELSDNIRKAFRQFIIAVEDRERFLLEFVEKLRQRRLATLHEQMAGLKSALAGLAETSDMLNKVAENGARLDLVDVAMKVTNGQRQLEQFAAIYKDLQPKEETFAFVIPDYSLLHDIRNQGGIIVVDENVPAVNNTVGNIATSGVGSEPVIPAAAAIPNGSSHSVGQGAIRRPFVHDISYRIPSPSVVPPRGGSACGMPSHGHDWELSVIPNSPCLHFGAPRSTPAIPGAIEPVKARNSRALSLSFATEGHEDGQVSRPWGLCVDRIGHILVSDRRNNRVQVFNPNGSLKFKFGRKGVGNGEFDLPAGICVDIDNRIIVVDKDNHRVQIFTSSGVFLLKFGSYGKEYGQFQYPWDVAVNSRRQIVVTDSRNHRIQQFDSDGRFIRQIVFDNVGQNKGIASPRGVCYTPTGNIIVSDFDNHCLYLIDPDKNEILSAKGHEGSGVQEFNRPSGLCCDDEGRIIIADSKNQRIVVYSPTLDYLWGIDIRPYMNPFMPPTLDEKDRTCDVALMPDGRIVFLIELSPDSKEGSNPYKRFVHIF